MKNLNVRTTTAGGRKGNRRGRCTGRHWLTGGFVVLMIWGLPLARGQEQPGVIKLDEAVVPSDKVSGFRGTSFVLGIDAGGSANAYGVFGIASSERRDHPCAVAASVESLNGSRDRLDLTKELCGTADRSQDIVAAFENRKSSDRLFVNGVRVCLNHGGTRVKGLQVSAANVSATGSVWDSDAKRKDERPNCNGNWAAWAKCAGRDEIAVALVAHFEAGIEPRSLTGLGLQCRRVIFSSPITDSTQIFRRDNR